MPFNQRANIFDFFEFSIVEAALYLEYVLKYQHTKLSTQQINYITSVSADLGVYIKTCREMQISSPSSPSWAERISQVNTNLMKTNQYLQDKIKNKFEEIALHFPSSGSLTIQDVYFTEILENLSNCYTGSLRHLNEMECLYDNNIKKNLPGLMQHNILYQFASLLGASFVPYCQNFDPLNGRSFNESQKFASRKAHCFGYVYHWIKLIKQNGRGETVISLNEDVLLSHKKQKEILKLSLRNAPQMEHCSSLQNYTKAIADTIAELRNQFLYRLRLHGEYSHSIGLRKDPQTNAIELNEPNYGIFLFKDSNSLELWFSLLINFYLANNIYFTHLELLAIDAALKPCPSLIAPFASIEQFQQSEKVISYFQQLLPSHDLNNKIDGSILQNSFLQAFNTFVSVINRIDLLTALEEYIMQSTICDFIFKKKESIFSFFKEENHDAQVKRALTNTPTGTAVLNILNKQKKMLGAKNPDEAHYSTPSPSPAISL